MEDLLGALGMLTLLSAFVLNVLGRLRANGVPYQAMNAVGAGILCWYSIQKDVPIFAVLEGVWCLAATVNLARGLLGRTSSIAGH
jgi:hypothetical protein